MDILLVEPKYTAQYAPLGLMKLATWHRMRGDNVTFHRVGLKAGAEYFGHRNGKLRVGYDIIYVAGLFTFTLPAIVEAVEKFSARYPKATIIVGGPAVTMLGINVIRNSLGDRQILWDGLLDGREILPGLAPDAEACPPDYSLFPKLDTAQVFTSRGCQRACSFCAVPKLEPEFGVRDWHADVDPTRHRTITFWDNNWLQKSPAELEADLVHLEKLKAKGIESFDYNQALDASLYHRMSPEFCGRLRRAGLKVIRFAYDRPGMSTDIEKAVRRAQEVGHRNITIYVMFNTPDAYDTPAFFYSRARKIAQLGARTFPMRFRSLDSTTSGSIVTSPAWSVEIIRGLSVATQGIYGGGIIGEGLKSFLSAFGDNAEDFQGKMLAMKRNSRPKAEPEPLEPAKRGKGRPALSDSETKLVSVRVPSNEWNRFCDIAEDSGTSPSEFLRELIAKAKRPTKKK